MTQQDYAKGRFSTAEDGHIFWQADATNPLPGDAVARLNKGDDILSPIIVADDDTLRQTAQLWLDAHIRQVLEPLFALRATEGEHILTDAAQEIGNRLFDHLGVIERDTIQSFIPALTPDLRQSLRRKRVNMGPMLVFMPDLVKPAAIAMRALLWGLWNDQALPMDRPADGRVSVTIDPAGVNADFYRMIGYPVFTTKAIRIDMLDRVTVDLYDQSKNWQFQAQHKYAEWLGCGIDDMYAVLEAMGHTRIIKDEAAAASPAPETVDNETKTEDETAETAPATKPELDFFKLKKNTKPAVAKKPRADKPSKPKKPFKKKKAPAPNKAKTFSMKAEENAEDSPFAILKQLQK